MSQPNPIWIDLSGEPDNISIDEHHRSYKVFYQLCAPSRQNPQMIMFIGDESKTRAIRYLEPSLGDSGNHKKICLHLLRNNTEAHSPILVADCELHSSRNLTTSTESRTIVGAEQHALLWTRSARPDEFDINTLAHIIYLRMLAPFTTVICYFADDLGGTRAVAKILASWITGSSGGPSDLPASTYPRVVIFKSDNRASFNEERATLDFVEELEVETHSRNGMAQRLNGQPDKRLDAQLRQRFGGLHVLSLPKFPPTGDQPDFQRDGVWDAIRERILQSSQRIQGRRRTARVAFSADHFKAFLHLSCQHFARDAVIPFSFMEASRFANPIPRDFSYHIASFLEGIKPHHVKPFATPLIASALTLDSFPPEMHHFAPAEVFRRFYDKILDDAQIDKAEVKHLFCQQVLANNRAAIGAATGHRAAMSRLAEYLQTEFNNKVCLSCVGPPAENNTLDCGHSLCDSCIVIHGRASPEEWTVVLDSCPLCGVPNKACFFRKPFTAGVRVISISGYPGDVFALHVLKEIEARLQLPGMHIGDYFDIAAGTGSGALIIAGLFCRRLSVSECTRFSRDTTHARSLLQPVPDSPRRYSSTRVNEVFRRVLGPGKTLFGCSVGTKVGLVATSTKDSSTCLFTSYNGPALRSGAHDHNIIRQKDPKDEILLWQVCRAASAAPPYLQSFKNYRGLVDEPNLAGLVLREQDFIWARAGKPPDVFLSLGASLETTVTTSHDQWLEGKSLGTWVSFYTDKLLASLFYIELCGLPQLETRGYACRVSIRCRLSPSEPHLRALVVQLCTKKARFYWDETSMPCVDQELLDELRRGVAYSRRINVRVHSLDDVINIRVDGITTRVRSISNCPYTISDIIEDQGLHCILATEIIDADIREASMISVV